MIIVVPPASIADVQAGDRTLKCQHITPNIDVDQGISLVRCDAVTRSGNTVKWLALCEKCVEDFTVGEMGPISIVVSVAGDAGN